MAGNKPNTVAVVTEIAKPVAEKHGVILWDVRFEKEGSIWFLRVFIDKDGSVTIDDCEKVSRELSSLLDEADPIEQSYVLEVSSPGVERDLVRDWHFEKYIGSPIQVRFIRPVEGVRDFVGELTGYDENGITMLLEDDVEMQFKKSETSFIRLVDTYYDDIEE